MDSYSLSCPDYHVWFIVSRSPHKLWLRCRFCGVQAKVLRFDGLPTADHLHLIMSDLESRRDPEHFPVKYKAVIHLIKEVAHEDDPDSNPFAI